MTTSSKQNSVRATDPGNHRLKASITELLHRGDAHGYNMLNGLDEFGLDPEAYDPSMIYRALREMEEIGWIVSYEGEQSRGPQRRVYRLTEEGERHLSIWIDDLRRAKREIDLLLRAYEQHVEAHHDTGE